MKSPLAKITSAAAALIAPDPVAVARAKLVKADAAVEQAKATLATLETDKLALGLDDDIEAHVGRTQVARTRLEIAERIRGEVGAEVAQAEVAAEKARKADLYDRARTARDAAAEKIRVGYAQLVADATALRELADRADGLVAESNRIRAGDYLAATEEYALDLPFVSERVIRTETERKWLFTDSGTPVPDPGKVVDREGAHFYANAAPAQGQTHLAVGGISNLERRVHQATVTVEIVVPAYAGVPGPRVPVLEAAPSRPERREHEATRERVVHQPLQGAPRMHAVRAIALGQGAGAA